MNVRDLLNEIDDLFDQIPLHAKASRKLDDLYEAFILGLVLEAARSRGARVEWYDAGGNVAPTVRLRGSPGELYTHGFTHAAVSFGQAIVYEVHAGIKVRGATVKHECDVVVVHAGIASARRAAGQTPRWSDTEFAVEAKAYVSTRVDLKIARQVTGLAVELRHQQVALVAAGIIEASAQLLASSWPQLGAWASVRPGTTEAADLQQQFALALLP